MRAKIGIQVKGDFEVDLAKKIIKEIQVLFSKAKNNIIKDIKLSLSQRVESLIRESPEYMQIVSPDGILRSELGLRDPERRISSIITQWSKNIKIVATKQKIPAIYSLDIGIIQSDYSDVLSLPSASFINDGRSGGVMDWLRWLLLEGEKTIIKQYHFSPAVPKGFLSRTGLGVMIKNSRSSWKIPSQFAGTDNDNFATRALISLESDIDKIVEVAYRKYL